MFSFDSRVRFSECTESGQLSLVGLINYLQDCSTFHSERLGVGIGHLKRNHFAWFISNWQIDILRMPRFDEKIRVSTWCYKENSFMAWRNFTIEDETGTMLVRADSLWFTYDTAEDRIIKVPASERVYLEGGERLDMPPLVRKLKVEGEGREASPVTITEQHLDTNGHVNNAQYVLIAVNAALAQLGCADVEPTSIAVQYKLAAHEGDVLLPMVYVEDGACTVDLTDEEGASRAVVRATFSADAA